MLLEPAGEGRKAAGDERVERGGLSLAAPLAMFIEDEALAGLDIPADRFWVGAADIFARLTPRNRELLAVREEMQRTIDEWHRDHRDRPHDANTYRSMLEEIGYIVPEPAPFAIDPQSVDPEVATTAAPQLVVPIDNARFLLNAANARWGSLYDALYGTDVISGDANGLGYDAARGAKVIAYARKFLDNAVPLASGSHADVTGYSVDHGALVPALGNAGAFTGYRGSPDAPDAILLRHHGLHIELVIDRSHPIGRSDPAGLADAVLESAVTTIADCEDSVAAVDGRDKVACYRNWLGLMRGDLSASFRKTGATIERTLNRDRDYTAPDGTAFTLPGRALMFVRNVGHLMTTPAVRLPDGSDAPEGILDAIVTVLIALHDLRGNGGNSRAGSVYIVKPKMHGPDEVRFAGQIFSAVETMLGLSRGTVKIGLMDEERRTSANLAACIHAAKDRIVFANTGFLDRTGDETHTDMEAGAVLPKAAMKSSTWMQAYEARNVAIALASGFSGRAQIGKGMWAIPDRMADMMEQKSAHPDSGADTAWVPSPTAATLHAMHYHHIDVGARQDMVARNPIPSLDDLLTLPLIHDTRPSDDDIAREVDNACQGILGYVARWVEQGVGCSKVPDIDDVGMMEDRATLRISSQLLANWLHHDIVTSDMVEAALLRMATKVDVQNAQDPAYVPIAPRGMDSPAFAAAHALVFQGREQPCGYTEPLLHRYRAAAKAG